MTTTVGVKGLSRTLSINWSVLRDMCHSSYTVNISAITASVNLTNSLKQPK